MSSIILWGPPGSGKTTLATIIAGVTGAQFHHLSAVASGVADVRKVIDTARSILALHRRRTILLIDEIHRFSKSQQDAVLQAVEEGTITLVGATTENPSFEVNAALLSRCRVFTLRQLTDAEVEMVVRRALLDPDRGVASLNVDLDGDALAALCGMANGDARVALNGLELAAEAATPDSRGRRVVTLDAISDVMQRRALLYDRAGEYHYDTISAFIKSVRGSDPDAAVYWLARMLEAGEDPLFVARRLVILAAEDIGLADPQAALPWPSLHTRPPIFLVCQRRLCRSPKRLSTWPPLRKATPHLTPTRRRERLSIRLETTRCLCTSETPPPA